LIKPKKKLGDEAEKLLKKSGRRIQTKLHGNSLEVQLWLISKQFAIDSVGQKILRKLQKPLVAAARVRRAQQQVIATRPLPTAWRKCYTVYKPSAI